MAYFERVRDVVSGPFSPEVIQQRMSAGWQMVSIEWRRELPTIQKLHDRYGAKGLAIVGINCSEGRSTAASFLRTNRYSIPTWLDVDGMVQNRYQVDGIPTLFILDAKGVVVARLVGLRDEDELLEALKKAGLKTRS